jgi:hypothetical protein
MNPAQFYAAMNDIHERVDGQRFTIRVRTKRTKDDEWFEGFPASDEIYQTGILALETPPSGLWYIELSKIDLIELARVFPQERSLPKWNYSRLLPSPPLPPLPSEKSSQMGYFKAILVSFRKNLSIRANERTGS